MVQAPYPRIGSVYGDVSGNERQGRVFTADVTLGPGERAEIPVSVEMSGTVLVDFDGTDPDWSPKYVWIERENGLRHRVGCRPFAMQFLRDGIERTMTVIPRLPAGAMTISFEDEAYEPTQHSMSVVAGKTHNVRLVMQAQ